MADSPARLRSVAIVIALLVLMLVAFVVFPWFINKLTDEAAKERWIGWQLILIYVIVYLLFGYLLYEMNFRHPTPLWMTIYLCLFAVLFIIALGPRLCDPGMETQHAS